MRMQKFETTGSARRNGSGEVARSFDEIIGQSRAWREIIRQMETVAPTDATVLIMGETGTGKEFIASGLHQRSRRKHQPLARANCACIRVLGSNGAKCGAPHFVPLLPKPRIRENSLKRSR